MTSFWNENPCVPGWIHFLKQAWNGSPPKLLESSSSKRSPQIPPGCEVRIGELEECGAVVEFWSRYFSMSKACQCAVSKEFLMKAIASGRWQLLLTVSQGQIVGTLVRRYLKGLRVYEARWPQAAAIDFFCVHPNWRKRGVGRALLDTVHSMTASPIPPHLIFWEGLRPTIPPLATGCFWMRRTGGAVQAKRVFEKERIQKAWTSCVKECSIWTEEPGEEITVWDTSGSLVVVWNTLHLTIPDGKPIGIVLSDLSSANLLANSKSPWGVLLLPQQTPIAQDPWSFDSMFQWIGYNLSIGKISTDFPRLGF